MLKIVALPIGDFIFSIFALYIGFLTRVHSITKADMIIDITGAKLFVFGSILIFSSFMIDMYNREKNGGKKDLFLRVCMNIFVTLIVLSLVFYIAPHFFLGRGFLAVSLVSFGVLQFLWHSSYRAFACPGLARNVLILGSGPLAQKIGEIVRKSNHRYVFAGHISLPSEQLCLPMFDLSVNGDTLEDTVKKEKAHKIIVSLSERRGVFPMKDILACKFKGVEVVDAPSFYEEMTGKLLIEDITPSWFIFSNGFRITPIKCFGKRIIDILFALGGLIFLLVSFPIIAVAIKINSSGPIFYKQLRVGVREKTFALYKFRTMYSNSEEKSGAVWAQPKDPRITVVGKLLRKTRIDEFPQFLNVLRGDMSIVGPRPERPEFVQGLNILIPYYSERHSVKPGITGWAQINYPYGSSVKDALEKLRYDLYYIKHFSLFLDIIVILDTIKMLLFGRGPR